MIDASSSLTDVAFEVCTALSKTGFTTVLTGGSAATVHTRGSYQSLDLDFVISLNGTGGQRALEGLGFRRVDELYRHSRSKFTLEFPPGPLAVGDDLITSWDTLHQDQLLLHILSPFDSCRDRLASFLFWNDLSGLEQALLVHTAHRDRVDLAGLRSWCTRERQAKKFELYEERFKALALEK
ncbi:MAG: hypothetical protein QM817_20070 [Archangium sp.]